MGSVRAVGVAVGGSGIDRIVAPCAAADHLRLPGGRTLRIDRVGFRVGVLVPVGAPFAEIAVEIVEAPGVGLFLSDGVSGIAGVFNEPRVVAERSGFVADIPPRLGAGAAGVFPLSLGWQRKSTAGLL